MADVFISYAREDRELVGRLAAQLEAAGVSCWWDKQLSTGDKYLERTEIELNAAGVVLVVWSKHSVGSHWVVDEASVGRESGRIAPISLDGSQPPLGFRQFQVLDFASWLGGSQAPLRELVETISRWAPERRVDATSARPIATPRAWWRRLTRVQMIVAAAAAASLVLLVGVLALWPRDGRPPIAVVVAVLPFDALDDDPAVKRMANIIPRDIADDFSRGGIGVTSSARSMAYAGDAKARAGAELGADLLLDGTVKREGNQAYVSVKLYHAKRGVTLWTTEMKADPEDRFVDDRLAQLAARMIYWPAPLRILNSDRPNAVEEMRAFLRVLQFNDNEDRTGAREAASKFARDAPDLSNAHTTAAIETINALPVLRPEERVEAFAFAQGQAEAALRLDPRNGSAYLASSFATAASKWADKIAVLRKGMEIDPGYTRFTGRLTDQLLATGATEEAVSVAKRAIAEEPLSAIRPPSLAWTLLANGELAELDRVLDAQEQIWPNDRWAARTRLRAAEWRGDPAEAAALLARRAPQGSPAAASLQTRVEIALIKARRSGNDADREEVGRLCSRIADEALRHPSALACMFAGGVLDWPDISIAAAEFLLPRIHNNENAWLLAPELHADANVAELFMPWMAPVRADSHIIAVFERLGLLEYWRKTRKWPDFCDSEPTPVCAQIKAS